MALPGLDRPPMPPPDISTQMGAPPEPEPPSGPGDVVKKQAMGAPNPHGFMLAQVDAVKKVLEQMAQTEPSFAPFAQRAISILDTGVSAVSSAPIAKPMPGMGKTIESPAAGNAPPPGGGGLPPLG